MGVFARLPRFRLRRGSMVVGVLTLTTMAITTGTEMDVGRLYVAKQKDQIISDAMTMAAAQFLPDPTTALAKANTVFDLYKSSYNSTISTEITFYPKGAAVPTSLSVSVDETVPTFIQGLMDVTLQPSAPAAAGRTVPSALLQGAVPLGVQYDQDFDLPADGQASSKQLTLFLGAKNKQKGNAWALDLPGSSGANDWSVWLEYGYTHKISVNDVIQSKSGTMSGPTQTALISDANSRLNRAKNPPYDQDTWQRFTPGNPRVVVLPLVDWTSAKGGTASLEVKGFSAFWIDDYQSSSNKLSGRFVRAVTLGTWPGVSVDPRKSTAFDGGFWTANLTK
jgi:hypothetical protein